MSEADFNDLPFMLKKKENNNNDKKVETPSNDESEDNDINNQENEMDKAMRKKLLLQNIDLEKLTGSERKIIFNAPQKTKDTSYGRNIMQSRRKAIFENKE